MNRKFIKNSNLVLRKVLNSNKGIDILKDFIESFLKIQIRQIKINNLPIINGEISKKYGIVDARITTKDGEELNVGIQIIDGDYIQNKMFLYYAKIHSNQVFYKDKRKLAKTITINILDTAFFTSDKYHKVIKIKSNIINDNILETMELHVLQLPIFNKNPHYRVSHEELWMLYLKGCDDEILNIVKEKNIYIKNLDSLIDKYWEKEKI